MSNSAGSSNESQIAAWLDKYLRGKGFSGANLRAAEAGFLGNFQVESGFSPAAFNAREGAHGIAQWENGRYLTGLAPYAASHGLSVNSLQADLGYLGQELSGPYSGVLGQLRGVTNPQQAAAIVDQSYEGSAGTTRSARQADATVAYQWLAGVGSGLAGILPIDPGNGAVPGTPNPPASDQPPALPYPADSLNGNLNPTQRTRIIDWLESVNNSEPAIVKWLSNDVWPFNVNGAFGLKLDITKYEQGKYPSAQEGPLDQQLLIAYNAIAKGGGVGYGTGAVKYDWHPPSWLSSPVNAALSGVKDILSWVANPILKFLISAALVIAGVLFVYLAVKMLGDTDSDTPSSPIAPPRESDAGAGKGTAEDALEAGA